jgi:DnaJ-class molecular chaperone
VNTINEGYYELLGVDPDADQKQIKEAYRRKALEFHPDRNHRPEAAEMMQAVNEAYAVLADPVKRQKYDSMRHNFGDQAHQHFRRSYSEQDIFSNSDFQQIFEEMARAFGLRGFDEIFKNMQGQGYRTFEYKRPGFYSKGFMFQKPGSHRPKGILKKKTSGLVGKLVTNLLEKAVGLQIPQQGKDIEDLIKLSPALALKGGPYAYFQKTSNKKLIVHIPPGVKHGQQIRLAGMGGEGSGGGPRGDLFLKVKIKKPVLERLKSLLGI